MARTVRRQVILLAHLERGSGYYEEVDAPLSYFLFVFDNTHRAAIT